MLHRFLRGLGSRSTAASRKQQDAPEALRRDNDKLSTIVSEKLDEGDIRGAVRTACSSDIIAPFNSDSFEKLKGKRTPQPHDRRVFPSGGDCDPLHVLPQDVSAAVNGFNPGAAGGPSGLRPQHLKDASTYWRCRLAPPFQSDYIY